MLTKNTTALTEHVSQLENLVNGDFLRIFQRAYYDDAI